MCFNVATQTPPAKLKEQFDLDEVVLPDWEPHYSLTAFTYPQVPVILSEEPKKLQAVSWGLIPHWVTTEQQAKEIRSYTLNAKSETVFEKPSFRASVLPRRCILPVDGFFEWYAAGGKKFPYFIRAQNKQPFALAGIYDRWVNTDTGEIHSGFSLLTTAANPLLARIHNSKQRQPLIMHTDTANAWLKPKLTRLEAESLFQVFPEEELEAFTVSKLVNQHVNSPEVQQPYDYPELGLMLF